MNFIESIINIYAPHACLGCGHEGGLLCPACQLSLPPPDAVCYRCTSDSPGGRTCADCRQSCSLTSLNSVTRYQGLAKDLIWKLKFDRAQAAAESMGRQLAALYGAALPADVLIVPVPTATSRVRKRGYDQAQLIARSLAKHTGLHYSPLLMRLGSQEQIGADKQQRQDQLRGVFRIKRPEQVKLARIMLIDDVLTTGATLEEAATMLRAAGAKVVGGLVYARV